MAMAQRRKIGPEEMNGFHLLSTTNSVGPLVPQKLFIVFVHPWAIFHPIILHVNTC